MRSPEKSHAQEGDEQNPQKEGSPLTSPEIREEQKLNPEHAMQEEKERLGGVLTSIAERIKRVPKEARLAMAVFIGASALAMGEGAMREAYGQTRQQSRSVVEDVFNKYSGESQNVYQKYKDETEQIREETGRAIDQYKHQKEVEVTGPGIHIRARQGYGGKGPRESLVREHRSVSGESIDELTMRTLRLLYDIPNRKQASKISH